jgi:thioredoxin reductase (NADPH)
MAEKIIIIGSGPAGLTAAIYASRAGLNPLVIEGKKPGGQLMSTSYIENWPGNQRILGAELMMNMRAHAEHLKTRFVAGEVIKTDLSKAPFTLWTNRNEEFSTSALIIATGSTSRKLGCPGEEEYWAKGVSTCAVCDGAFYPGKKVIIVGGGDTAMEDASFMSNITNDITVVHIHDKLTASHSMQERVLHNKAINVIYNSTVTAIKGDGNHVTHVEITNKQTGETVTKEAGVVFIAIGLLPNSAPFKGFLKTNDYGFITTFNESTATSVPGIFAAGDVVDFKYRQAITSAGTGCKAALDAEHFLHKG